MVFDTYKSSKEFERLIEKFDFPKGFVVAAACKDDCMTQLSDKCKQWFGDMGSKDVWELEYQCAFAFVGLIGKKEEASEKSSTELTQQVSVTRIFNIRKPGDEEKE